MLVITDLRACAQGIERVGEIFGRNHQEESDIGCQLWQDGPEVDGEDAESLNAGGADIVQTASHLGFFGQFPGLVLVDIFIDAVGQGHDFAHHLAKFPFSVQLGHRWQSVAQMRQQLVAVCRHFAQLAVETLADKARCTRGDIHILADEVAVDPQHEIFGVEVDVLVFG